MVPLRRAPSFPKLLMDRLLRAGKDPSGAVHDETVGLLMAGADGEGWFKSESHLEVLGLEGPSQPVHSSPNSEGCSKRAQWAPVGPRVQEFCKEWNPEG